MKQLKIIADQYNSQTSVSQASFNESITIAPNSRIWLDKMSMNILSAGVMIQLLLDHKPYLLILTVRMLMVSHLVTDFLAFLEVVIR
jgi:hypothetical protein